MSGILLLGLAAVVATVALAVLLVALVVRDYQRRRRSDSRVKALVTLAISILVIGLVHVSGSIPGVAGQLVLILVPVLATAATLGWAWWLKRRRPLHEQLLAAPAAAAEESARSEELRAHRRRMRPVVAAFALAAVVLYVHARWSGAVALVLVVGATVLTRRSLRRQTVDPGGAASQVTRIVIAAGAAFALAVGAAVGAGHFLLRTPAWTRIDRAEVIAQPAHGGVAAQLYARVWLRKAPPTSERAMIWIELWTPAGKWRVAHAEYGPADARGTRSLVAGDLFDPAARTSVRLPQGTSGGMAGLTATLTLPLEGLRSDLTGWRALTLTGKGGLGDEWPRFSAAAAAITRPRPSGTLGDLAIQAPRAALGGTPGTRVLTGSLTVAGDFPDDADVAVSIGLWSPTAELQSAVLLFGAVAHGARPLRGVVLPHPGVQAAPTIPPGTHVQFSGQTLTYSIPLGEVSADACCYRVTLSAHSPAGGGGSASRPLLTEHPLVLSGVRRPAVFDAPAPAALRVVDAHVALRSGGAGTMNGTIELAGEPAAKDDVDYLVRLLDRSGATRGTAVLVFGPLRHGTRALIQAMTQVPDTSGGMTTTDPRAHPAGVHVTLDGRRLRFELPLAGVRDGACCWTASVGSISESSGTGPIVNTPVHDLAR